MVKADRNYKTSKYNWLVTRNKESYVFNGITTAIAKINNEHKEYLIKCLNEPERPVDITMLPPELINTMEKCGFIIESDFDEVKYLDVLSHISRYNTDIRSITAVITTNCNFGCSYCFQNSSGKQKKSVMSTRTIDEIVKKVGETSAKRMTLCLFGGEPLLYPQTCYELSQKVKDAWGDRTGRLSIPIITNGYFLTKDIAEQLSSVGVSVAQVTLDGTKEVHNKRRPLLDGSPTFDVIVANIIAASEHMELVVRVNIDKGIDYKINELEEIFKGLNVKMRTAVTRYEHCGQPERTSENMTILEKLKEDAGEPKMEDLQLKISGCSAVSMGMFTVMPNGDLVRCWNEIEREPISSERSSIFDKNIYNIRNIYKWLARGPYSIDSPCHDCKMLPNCGGLCPDDMMRNGRPYCHIKAETFKKAIVRHI